MTWKNVALTGDETMCWADAVRRAAAQKSLHRELMFTQAKLAQCYFALFNDGQQVRGALGSLGFDLFNADPDAEQYDVGVAHYRDNAGAAYLGMTGQTPFRYAEAKPRATGHRWTLDPGEAWVYGSTDVDSFVLMSSMFLAAIGEVPYVIDGRECWLKHDAGAISIVKAEQPKGA